MRVQRKMNCVLSCAGVVAVGVLVLFFTTCGGGGGGDGDGFVGPLGILDWTLLAPTSWVQWDGKASGGGGNESGQALGLDSEDRILVAGRYNNGATHDMLIMRYNPDGTLDTGFDTDGWNTWDSGFSDGTHGMAVLPDDRVLVVGNKDEGGDIDVVLTKFNSNGTLDATFGPAGAVFWDGGFGNDRGMAVAVQSDNKILVVGNSYNGNDTDILLMRYTATGALDAGNFGANGWTTWDGDGGYDSADAVATQPDGKILVAGRTQDGVQHDVVLLRFNTDGSLDTTFDADGVATWHGGGLDVGHAMVMQSDGKILVAGESDGDILLLRFNATGSLDTGFGTGGAVIWDSGRDEIAQAVALLSDGKILVAGTGDSGVDEDVVLIRCNADGSLDDTFGTNGVSTWDGGNTDEGRDLLVLPDESKVLVAGVSNNGDDTDVVLVQFQGGVVTLDEQGNGHAQAVAIQPNDGKILVGGRYNGPAMFRFNPNGSLDTSFDTDGVVMFPLPFTQGFEDMVIHHDGRILLTGYVTLPQNVLLIKANTDGSLNSDFGTDGVVTWGDGDIFRQGGKAIALPTENKILVAGYSENAASDDLDVLLLRFDYTEGTLDAGFGNAGATTWSNVDTDSIGNAMAVQTDGRILVAGESNDDLIVLRYNADGKNLHAGFGDAGVATWDSDHTAARADALAVQSNGQILVGGYAEDIPEDQRVILLRFDTDGTLDAGFGNAGVASWDGGFYSEEIDLAVQPDGKILVAGSNYDNATDDFDLLLLRFNTNGTLDTEFGNDGVFMWDGGGWDFISDMAVQSDGRILLVGSKYNVQKNTYNVLLLRIR